MVRPPNSEANNPEADEFQVQLEVFSGPFDLLLRLIARRELDITEVSLARVTDEFITHMKRVPDLSSTTEFLVVAATLLEMKASRLLPQPERESSVQEDLSAWDLLFSRLLQYRAFKGAAASLEERLGGAYYPRQAPMEPQFAQLLPELLWRTSPAALAKIAATALAEKPRPDEAAHVNRPGASFEEELATVRQALIAAGSLSFSQLVQDTTNHAVIVTRFLAILELYRQGRIVFDQPSQLGPLEVIWRPLDDQ